MSNKFDFDKYFSKSKIRSNRCAEKVRKIYENAVLQLSLLAMQVEDGFDYENETFRFSETNERIREEATEEIRRLYSEVYNEIKSGIGVEWEQANKMNDDLIKSVFASKILLDTDIFKIMFERNRQALDAFFARKSQYGGLNLSQRVWKYTSQFKEEMELSLSVSLGQGKSAQKIAKEIKRYLNEPDKLFRRVRDKNGNLKLSKRAKEYHPGQGVYRSSFQNAMRCARTETNMAYRSADNDRWGRMDFIVGQEIRLSNNHTTKMPNGKVVPLTDICDKLKGRYPKTFKFVGWHPNCRCVSIPILKTENEIDFELENDVKVNSVNEVVGIPANFREWLAMNSERIANAKGKLPYFLKDNMNLLK